MLGRQLSRLLRGHLLLNTAGCQQLSSITQTAASVNSMACTSLCAVTQALHAHAADLQHSSQVAGAFRCFTSTSASFSDEASSTSSSGPADSSAQSQQPQPGQPDPLPEQQQPLQQVQVATAAAAAAPQASSREQQQPLAAAYGPRKVTPKSGKATAGPVKREGIVHVNSTLNNTIMVLTDRDSKVQTWTSGGTIGYRNANKATPMAAEQAAKELAKRALDLGFHSVVVKLKGMGKNKQFAVQSLAANGLTVTQLWDVTPIPYNGCRLPRRRRV